MRLADFDYELPEDRVAQAPVEPRDSARLLLDRGDEPPGHARVRDLPDLLAPGDVLVVNRSRVLAARLLLTKPTGGQVEVLLLEPVADLEGRWRALVRPSRKVPAGAELTLDHLRVVVGQDDGGGIRLVDLHGADGPVTSASAEQELAGVGRVPLPPYIHRALEDPRRYQTVFATAPGSVAAPTAGLHLTPELLERITEKGVTLAEVELHVGLDTFRPVQDDDPTRHQMHTERFVVPEATRRACAEADRVVAVGTTTVRALESDAAGRTDRTDLFIHRPYEWRVVDVMMTNFHLPRSTLLMMIDAFVGERWRTLYETALADGYRFLSFGDAMLLDRHR